MKGKRNAVSCVLLKRKQLIGALLQTYEKKVERIEKPIDFINFNLYFIYSNLFYSILFWFENMFDLQIEYTTSTQHTKILQTKIQNLKNRGDTTGRVNVKFKI